MISLEKIKFELKKIKKNIGKFKMFRINFKKNNRYINKYRKIKINLTKKINILINIEN